MTRQRLPAAERRVQIADAALTLLAERGAAHLTALALAREVGVADASLFRHFPSMEAIVQAAIDRFGEALDASLDRPERDPLDRLRGFFLHRLQTLRSRPELLRLAFNDRLLDASGAAGAERVRAIVQRSREFMEVCLQEGQASGQIRQDLPLSILFFLVGGIMRGAAVGGKDGAPDTTSAEQTWESVLRLLVPSTPVST